MCLLRSDELWIYDQLIYEYYLNLLWILICMIWYLCNSLRTIGLVCPTRLVFLAMGEALSFGFNLAWFLRDTYWIVATKGKKMGFSSYCLSLFLYIMSSYLKCYFVLSELNTLDAGRSRSMCAVLVVDAKSFWSTCLGRVAYIHDHT